MKRPYSRILAAKAARTRDGPWKIFLANPTQIGARVLRLCATPLHAVVRLCATPLHAVVRICATPLHAVVQICAALRHCQWIRNP